jgi:hypothetical protein
MSGGSSVIHNPPRLEFRNRRDIEGGEMRAMGVGRLTLVALFLGVLAGVAGCSTPHKEIDVIGVVASEGGAYDGPDMVDTYTFDDGHTYSMR